MNGWVSYSTLPTDLLLINGCVSDSSLLIYSLID